MALLIKFEPHTSVLWPLLYQGSLLTGPSRTLDLRLKGPDGVTVFFTNILLHVFTEHDNGVIVLFHAALWALN
jgi:hypothetical protein